MAMGSSRVAVECYAGSGYPTRPRAFTVRGARHTVADIQRVWRTPDALWFRVRAEQGGIFTLAFYDDEDAWIVLSDKTTEEDQR